ncbi:MAG: GGDEF domain-containing protein [Aliivibrio sp.]|nr:GGDEF domain-containing protein [Aliivibrio sp.]
MDNLLTRISSKGIDLMALSSQQSLMLWHYVVDEFAESDTEKAYALLMCSEFEVEFNQTQKSIQHLQRALLLLSLPNNIDLILQIYSSLSYRYTDIGEYQSALDSLYSLSKLAVDFGDNEFYIQSILGIGNLCSIYGDHLKALRYYQKIESLSKSIQSNNLSLRYRLYIVACLLDLNRLSKARQLLNECHVIKYVSDDLQLVMQVQLYSAKLLRLQNKPQTALDALIVFRKENINLDSFPWLNKLFSIEASYCLIQLQRGELADVLITNQLKRTKKYSQGYYIRQLLDVKSDALASCHNFSAALECEKEAHQLTVDIVKYFPINELGGHALRRLTRLELQLRLNISESENIKLKKVSDEQKDTVAKLQKDVFHDSLTKLFNHRWYKSTFANEIKPKLATYQLLVVDIDNFKSINDEYSHLTGDVVLKLVAQIIEESSGSNNYALRYGGEEFIIIVTSNNRQYGKEIADRCRLAISEFDWNETLHDRLVTVSIGMTVCQRNEDINTTFLRADKALYQAKRSGKNRVCIY